MDEIKLRLPEIDNKILIKDWFWVIVFLILLVAIIFNFYLEFNLKVENLINFEQAIFVIISAIMLVFNESLISYSTINKISTQLNKLSSKDIKEKVFMQLNSSDQNYLETQYEAYLNILKERVDIFKKSVEKFRNNSYKLYMIFTICGFLVLLVGITKTSDLKQIDELLSNFFDTNMKLQILLTNFFILIQSLFIPIWVFAAHQAQKQKSSILMFFENPSEIVNDFKNYLDEINAKEIKTILSKDG
jgi:bacteriorhodopsin